MIKFFLFFVFLIGLSITEGDGEYDSQIGRMKLLAPKRDERKQVPKPIVISPMFVKPHPSQPKFRLDRKAKDKRKLSGIFPPFTAPPLFIPPKPYGEPVEKSYTVTGASKKAEIDENKTEFEFNKNMNSFQKVKNKYADLKDLVKEASKAIKNLEQVYRKGMNEVGLKIERIKNTQHT